MTLAPGTRIGVYEVVAAVGQGGMGEVWKARDTRLGRDVAIKTLAEAFAADPDRLARFEREAKLLASLNHPNIGGVYGLERMQRSGDQAAPAADDGPPCLVMELVEGPTLADRIAAGPLSPEETLLVARQIADALAAAHEQGIVHRDLKPANVKLRPDGLVKVLDFGLAKAATTGASADSASQAPTLTTPAMTRVGVALGTPAYMSPEQAQGRAVDRHADIWAFGVLLFEASTGKNPFSGDSVAETLAAVQKTEPDWQAVDPSLRPLVRWCLEKDPRRRLHDIRDGIRFLDDFAASPARKPVPSRRGWMAAAVVASLALAVAAWWLTMPDASPRGVVSLDITVPDGGTLTQGQASPTQAISPDGRLVAFVATSAPSCSTSIWIKPLDAPLASRLEGTDGATGLFWAPDSRTLGFEARGMVRRIDTETGAIRELAPLSVFRGASWGSGGTIVLARLPEGLLAVPEDGGAVVPVTQVTPDEQFNYYPSFLPDGEHFLYSSERGVWVGSLSDAPDQSNRVAVLDVATNAAYVPAPQGGQGRLLFARGQTLYAQSFDPDGLRLTGTATAIADGVGTSTLQVFSVFSASPDGTLVTAPAAASGGFEIVRLSRSGELLERWGGLNPVFNIELSPGGTKAALLVNSSSRADVHVMDLARGSMPRIAVDGIYPYFAWSPDGREIAYSSFRDSPRVYRIRESGGEPEELLAEPPGQKMVWDWTRRGLVYGDNPTPTRVDIVLAPDLSGSMPVSLLADGYFNYGARLSPDSRWLAYTSNAGGRDDVYVGEFMDPGARQIVSLEGGRMPVWNDDGTELFFQSLDGRLMSVNVESSDDGLELGRPVPLFDLCLRTAEYPGARQWSARPRAGDFLVARLVLDEATSLRVSLDWPAILDRDE